MSMTLSEENLFSLRCFYPSENPFYISQQDLEKMKSGEGSSFPYTESEIASIVKDSLTIQQLLLSEESASLRFIDEPTAYLCIKTQPIDITKLIKEKEEEPDIKLAYISVEDVILPQLCVYQESQTLLTQEKAYEKAIPASSFTASILIADLIQNKYPFYFDTTHYEHSGSQFYSFLKREGYKIEVDYILDRSPSFEELIEKTALKQADIIRFYHSQDLKLTATWERNPDREDRLRIIDRTAYSAIGQTALSFLETKEDSH